MIVCRDLSYSIGKTSLFSNFSYSFKQDCRYALIGPNGCGKTTLLKILANILKPVFGEVTSQEKSFYMACDPAFFMDLSVWNNLYFYAKLYDKFFCEKLVSQVLCRVGLAGKQILKVRNLSTGQKKRLVFAVILLVKPKIILADEPTNGLDLVGMKLACEIFEELQKENATTLIVATHEELIKSWCPHTVFLTDYQRVKNASIVKKVEKFI